MSQLKSKNKIKRIIYSWPVLILLLLVILLVGKSVWGVYRSEKISSKNKQSSEERYEELVNKSDLVASEIELLKTDKGVEMEIRDKFRVIKEGEQLAIIINSDKNGAKGPEEIEKEKIWVRIWNFLRD